MNAIVLSEGNMDKQHFVMTDDEMCQLATPLAHFGIGAFSRVRIWSDQSISLLTTNPSFSSLFIREKFYEFALAGKHDQYESGMVLLDGVDANSPEMDIVREAFKDHCKLKLDFGIIEREKEFTDLFWFGTHFDMKNVANIYLNRIDYIKKYVEYFKKRAEPLLRASEKHRLVYPTTSADKTFLTSSSLHEVLSDRLTSHVDLYGLTPCESLCAKFIIQGESPKNIARKLSKSVRTVEKHLINVRKKIGAKTLLELVACLNR